MLLFDCRTEIDQYKVKEEAVTFGMELKGHLISNIDESVLKIAVDNAYDVSKGKIDLLGTEFMDRKKNTHLRSFLNRNQFGANIFRVHR